MKRPRVPGQRLLADERPTGTGQSEEYDVHDRKKWGAADYKLACDGRYSTDQAINLLRHKQVAQMRREIAYMAAIPVRPGMALDTAERDKRLTGFLTRYPKAIHHIAKEHPSWSHVTELPIKVEHL